MRINRKTLLTAALWLLIAAAGSAAGAVTTALYTDSATATGNSFTAGTVTVRLSDADQASLASVAASISGSNVAPGDLKTGFIEVANTGSLEQRYAVTTTDTTAAGAANTAMSAALSVGVDSRPAGSACTVAQGGAGQTLVKAAGTTLQTMAIGDATSGFQAGDRTLAPGVSERLCFYVILPTAATNTSQGGAASYTFNFNAEQTANN